MLCDLDHVVPLPLWFYDTELMDATAAKATKITRHPVWVGALRQRRKEPWKRVFVLLPQGVGAAVRDRIRTTDGGRKARGRGSWLVRGDFDGWT